MSKTSRTFTEAAYKGWETRRKNGNVPSKDQFKEWGKKGGNSTKDKHPEMYKDLWKKRLPDNPNAKASHLSKVVKEIEAMDPPPSGPSDLSINHDKYAWDD